MITKTGPACPADIIRAAVKNTTKKADITDAVVEALAPWPGETFTVWLTREDRDRAVTRTEMLPGGIEVEYWGSTPVSVSFPAGAEVEVAS